MLNQWQQLVKQKRCSSTSNRPPYLYDLTEYGLISVEGEDSRRFLQGQVTADIDQLTATRAGLTAVCTPQGRMRSFFLLIARSPNHFLCLMPRELIDSTLDTLTKFAVFYQTSLKDVTQEWAVYGIDDPTCEPLTVTLPTANVSKASAAAHADQAHSILSVGWFGHRSIRLCPIEAAIRDWNEFSGTTRDYSHWLAADIQAGIPRLYPETIDTFLPHNLNLPELSAVSFNKGCYTGQEVIARMHYKGKLKSHMRYLVGEAAEEHPELPLPGNEIIADDTKAGQVVCAALVDHQWHLLAFCKDSIDSATKIQCKLENAPILSLRR